MAKLSGRPPSRQSQQDAPAARTTRSTRSASREPSERPASRGKQNKAPATPKRGGRKTKRADELPAVEERPTVEEQIQDEIEHAEQVAAEEVAAEEVAARRASVLSGMSGTTFKTSFSQEEISELDAEIMIDVLPSLASAADELAKLIVPADPKARAVVRKEIRMEGSKYNKLFNNRINSLNVHKDSFGSTEYIQPTVVLRALFGVQNVVDIPTGPWRPDAVFYKINLAQMLKSVLITAFDNVEMNTNAYNAMEALDINFPTAIAGSEFSREGFELCLAILTQLAIIRLSAYLAEPGFHGTEIITATFFAPDEDGASVFRHNDALHLPDLNEADIEIYANAIEQLQGELLGIFENSAGPVAALGALRTQYPWEQFVEQVVSYYFARSQELDDQVASHGGGSIQALMSRLYAEVERRLNVKVAEEKRQSFGRPGGTPKKGFGKAGIKEAKARLAAASTAPAAPIAQMTEQVVVQPDNTAPPPDEGFQRLENDDVILQPRQAQSTARSTLQAMTNLQNTQKQKAAKGKARLTDRQSNAQKVAFDESQLTQYAVPPTFQYPSSSAQAQGPYYQSPRGAKRSRQQEEDDDEEDDFEPTQDRPFDAAAADQRRRQLPPYPPQQPRSSAAATNQPIAPRPSASATPSPRKRQRQNPGSSIPPPPAPYDPDDEGEISKEEQMRRIRINARHGTIVASQRKPQQSRRNWTPTEEVALVEMIENECEDGISYSKLKAHDAALAEQGQEMFEGRSAEDLRFKARNLKVMYLKGRTALPRNFQYIVLDKKAKDVLANSGIEYHQDRIRGGLAAEPVF